MVVGVEEVFGEEGGRRQDLVPRVEESLAGHVERARRAGNGRLIVTFGEIGNREDAARLTNVALYAPPIDDPSQLWVHELIGAHVVERDGTNRGRCVAVVDNPAADLLERDSGALVPVTFGVEHDRATITIDPPDGLFDL